MELTTAQQFEDAGVDINAAFLLLLNTTSTDVTYEVPTEFPEVQGTRDVFLPRGPPGPDGTVPNIGEPYFLIRASGTLTILDIFVLEGELDLLVSGAGIDLQFGGTFKLEVAGTLIHDFAAAGGLRLDNTGVAAALVLTAESDIDALGFTLNGEYRLEANTTGTDVVIQGVTVAGEASPYFRITLDGSLSIGALSLAGSHRFEVGIESIEVTTDGTLSVEVGGGFTLFEFEVSGLLEINTSGIFAVLDVDLSDGFSPPEWFDLDAEFSIGINTTDQERSGIPAFLGAKIFATGTLSVAGTVELSGTFNFVLSPTLISVESDFDLALKDGDDTIFEFSAAFDFELTLPGIAEEIVLNFDSPPAPGFELSAAFLLQINTTGQAQGNLEAGIYARVQVNGSLTVLDAVTLEGTFFLEATLNGVTLRGDFTLVAQVVGTTLFAMEGEADLLINFFGLAGRMTLTFQQDGNLSSNFGFGISADAAFVLELNTRLVDVEIQGTIVKAGSSLLRMEGSLELPGLVLDGVFIYQTGPLSLAVSVDAHLDIGLPDLPGVPGLTLLSFDVAGGLELDLQGIAGVLDLTLDAGSGIDGIFGATLEATFRVEVNTGGARIIGDPETGIPLEAGAYARVRADGRLSLSAGPPETVTGFFLEGFFLLKVDGDGVRVDAFASLNLAIAGQTVYTESILGFLTFGRDGLVAQLTYLISTGFDLSTIPGLGDIGETGLGFTGAAVFEIDTPNQIFARLTIDGDLILTVLGEEAFSLSGTFRLTVPGVAIVIEVDASLSLAVAGTPLATWNAVGAMRLGISGLVASITLTESVDFTFAGNGFLYDITATLEINLSAQAVEFIGELQVDFPVGPFVRVRGEGSLDLLILNDEVFSLNGSFIFQRRLESILVGASGDMLLQFGGAQFLSFDVSGDLFISFGGIAAALDASIDLDANVPESFGFTFSSSAAGRIEVNTTSNAIDLPNVGVLLPGFRLQLEGDLAVPGLTLAGRFEFLIEPVQVPGSGRRIDFGAGSRHQYDGLLRSPCPWSFAD